MTRLAEGPFPVLDSDLLRTFVAIADTGSFRKAAQQVFRTPSAVSMQIKKLEEIVGRELFVRAGRGVGLTPDGEALLGYGRRILKLNEEAVARFLAPSVEGVTRFGAPDDFGTRFLPGILSRFAASHPAVDVEVFLEESVSLLRRLESGDLDLTLVTTAKSEVLRGTNEIVFTEPLVWAGLKGGVAWEREPLPLALAAHGCPWRAAALNALDRMSTPYRVSYTCPHSAGQEAALLSDLAIAPVPASLIRPPFQRLGSGEGLPPLGDYHIVLCRRPDLGPAGQALAAHIEDSFRNEPRRAH